MFDFIGAKGIAYPVSFMGATFYLAKGVTLPTVPYPPSRLMDVVPLIAPRDDVAAVVDRHLADDPSGPARAALVEHYLGDPTPGVATARFIAACEDAMSLRDRAWTAQRAAGATGP